MAILSFDGIGQTFAETDIFTMLSATMESDHRVGLVGPNGIGKTTLLQIIAGLAEPSAGTIYRQDGMRLGYLRQEAVLAFGSATNALHQEMLDVFAEVRQQEARLREIEHKMSDGSATDEDFDEYGSIQEAFELAGGYDYERRIDRTLEGLGFGPEDYATPIAHLSGGQKTRALLARLLLTSPDLLILDEPTNHLDVEAIAWLEGMLKVWPGALLIVSHDRYFLDKVVNTVWEMSRTGLQGYRGNYSAYLKQRDHRQARSGKEWDALIERFTQELAFIEKHFAGSRHDQAVGRLKRTAREVEAVRLHGIDAINQIKRLGWGQFSAQYELKREASSVKELRSAIRGLSGPNEKPRQMRIALSSDERSGDTVMRTRRLQIGYPGKMLFESDDIELRRGDRVALIGQNGAGKSTLLRTMLDQIPALGGSIQFGHNIQVGYFAQAHDGLDVEATVLDELMRHKASVTVSEARQHLAPYLFQGDTVFKQVSALSGGERGRLALAILSLKGANFLLLDEPTNHLDIHAQEVLQEVLEAFEGSILLVSHDRYLVDRLATQIWDLRDEYLNVHQGSYQEYLSALETAPPRPARQRISSADRERAETQVRITALENSLVELADLLDHARAAENKSTVQQLEQEQAQQQEQLDSLRESLTAQEYA